MALADFRISFDLAPGTPLGDGVEGSFFMETRRKGARVGMVEKRGKFKGVAIQINTDPASYGILGVYVSWGDGCLFSPPSSSSTFEDQKMTSAKWASK